MDKKTAKRLYRSLEERTRLVEDYAQSGQSMSAYCREHNLSLSSFSSWKAKEKGAVAKTKISASRFIELAPAVPRESRAKMQEISEAQEPTLPESRYRAKLQLGRGITLELNWSE